MGMFSKTDKENLNADIVIRRVLIFRAIMIITGIGGGMILMFSLGRPFESIMWLMFWFALMLILTISYKIYAIRKGMPR